MKPGVVRTGCRDRTLPQGHALGTLAGVDRLRLAYCALAVGLMGFGAIWGWLGLRGRAPTLPLGPRLTALLFLLLAAGGTVAAVILEARTAQPW